LLLFSFNLKSSLAVEVAEGEVDARGEVVEGEVVPHVQVEVSRLRRLPHARPLLVRRLRARPLGQVLRAPQLVLGQPVVLPPRRLRKLALAPAALRQGKVLPLHSGQPEQVQMSLAAVQRLDR
jgi:hypothetical protein